MQEIKDFLTNADIADLLITGAINLVIAAIIFYVGKLIARLVKRTLEKLLRKREIDAVLVDFLGNIVYALVLVVAVVAAFDQLGIPATSFVAIIGAAGLAIGLALKDSLANFASGVMLALFRPFTKGDFIEAAGVTGSVDEIRLVSTTLTTPDNKLVIVPNSSVYNSAIINYSARDTRRIDMVFGVSYDDDLKLVADILARICADHPLVLGEPETKIFIMELGGSSVDFVCRPWVNTADYWAVRADLLKTGKLELEAAGCSIPYPQTDVHLHQVSPD